MNAKNEDLPDDPNAQSIVMKVQHHHDQTGELLGSIMLPGDSDASAWRRSILRLYSQDDVRSSILLASHHGSISFFDDPADERSCYTAHMRAIQPSRIVVSVGPNQHGHPDPTAIGFYKRYSSGSDRGVKIYRTDEQGSIKLTFKDEGGWLMSGRQ